MGHEAIHGPLLAALALRVRGRELHAGAVQQLGKPKLLLSQSRFGGVKLPGLAFNSLPSFQLWPEQVAFDGSNVDVNLGEEACWDPFSDDGGGRRHGFATIGQRMWLSHGEQHGSQQR